MFSGWSTHPGSSGDGIQKDRLTGVVGVCRVVSWQDQQELWSPGWRPILSRDLLPGNPADHRERQNGIPFPELRVNCYIL
jgi:hypothetical protein